MHVKYGPRLNRLVVLGGVLWLLIMFALTLIDYVSRQSLVPDPAGLDVPAPLP